MARSTFDVVDIIEILVHWQAGGTTARPRSRRAWRGSPESGEIGCSDQPGRAGLVAPARERGQAGGLPAVAVPRAAVVSGVRDGWQGRCRQGDAQHPLGRRGGPVPLSGRGKASGGAVACVARPAQRARRGHAASFPASDRS